MSSVRKCMRCTCKKSINIKKDNHLKSDYDTRRRAVYYCEHCGKELIKDFENTGGRKIISNYFNYYVHMGQGTEWIHSFRTDGLIHINLDYKGGETKLITIDELIEKCNCDEGTKAVLRKKAHALNT